MTISEDCIPPANKLLVPFEDSETYVLARRTISTNAFLASCDVRTSLG